MNAQPVPPALDTEYESAPLPDDDAAGRFSVRLASVNEVGGVHVTVWAALDTAKVFTRVTVL
jgi:hypothetical protein